MTPGEARAVLARLIARIAPEVDLDEVDADAALTDAAGLDSMDFLRLMDALYEETGVDMPDRDYPRLGTVAGCVDYLVTADVAAGTLRRDRKP